MLRLADAQWRSGDGAEARTTFEQAIEGGRRLGNGELLAQAALGYVTALGGFLLYARFEVGGTGVGLLEEALSALPPTTARSVPTSSPISPSRCGPGTSRSSAGSP